MKKTHRNIGIAVAIVIVILLLLPKLVNVNSFRPKIESELTTLLGRKVEVGDLSLSLLRGRVSAEEIRIADDAAFNKAPFLTAKSLKIGVDLMPLIFSKRLNITGITLDEPSITLLSDPSGKWNISSLAATRPEAAPKSGEVKTGNLTIGKLSVVHGKLTVGKVNSQAKPLSIDNVNLELKNFSSAAQFPFTMTMNLPSDGNFELEGEAGPIEPSGTPIQATLKIQKLDLASLGMAPSVGLGGMANLDGTLKSDGKLVQVKGSLSLDKLKMAPKGSPAGRRIQAQLATNYDLKGQAGSIATGDISVGKAVAHLTGNYRASGDATLLDMKFSAPGLPVDEVASLLPALGVTLPAGSGLKGGTLSASLSISGPTDKLIISGPIKLENCQLEGFDLSSKLSAISAFSGKVAPSKDTKIQNASTTMRVAPQGIGLDSINVTVPSLGTLTGGGSISPSSELSFNMVAELTGAGRGLTEKSGGVPFKIGGTTSDPKFIPDVGGMAGSAARKAIKGKTGAQSEPTSGSGGLRKKLF